MEEFEKKEINILVACQGLYDKDAVYKQAQEDSKPRYLPPPASYKTQLEP
ncbi:MAG: hypothetical protein HY367_00415 [Candidatus Aenigmarchaeota archaeon]|nr:hypothetical protein [Candidatus Aenigmarchaeota archaeon]